MVARAGWLSLLLLLSAAEIQAQAVVPQRPVPMNAVPMNAAPIMVIANGNWQIHVPRPNEILFRSRDRERALRELDSKVQLKLRSIQQTVGLLSDAQEDKLLLAARADIHEFLNDVRKVESQVPVAEGQAIEMEQYMLYRNACVSLRQRLDVGLHDQGSLFHKTLGTVLAAEQLATLDEQDREGRQQFVVEGIEKVAAVIQVRAELTADQKQQLIQLMLPADQPLPDVRLRPGISANLNQTTYAMYRLSLVPEEELRGLFNEEQWKTVSIYRSQGATFRTMLQDCGILPPEVPR